MHHAVLLAKGVIETHELGIARAGVSIRKTKGADVLLLHAGKQPVELRKEVFAVPLAERYSHAEADDALDLRFGAIAQNAENVFLRVVDKRQNGGEPHNRGDPGFMEPLQRGEAGGGGADIWFQLPAKRLVVCGERHLHHAFCPLVDGLQEINIAQHAVGFCLQCEAKAVPERERERAADIAELRFKRDVGGGHCAGAEHAGAALASERVFQKRESIFFDFNILESVIHMIAAAS